MLSVAPEDVVPAVATLKEDWIRDMHKHGDLSRHTQNEWFSTEFLVFFKCSS
jgi:hypothetical protein